MPLTETELRSLQVFQAGMGVNISSPDLARAVGEASDRLNLPTMVTISGTGAPLLITAILQAGDPGGHYRRILQEKPIRTLGAEVLDDYCRDPNLGPHKFRYAPNPSELVGNNEARKGKLIRLLVASNYALVRRAKEGHNRPVAVNFLTKIELPHAPELYGAQAGGADVIIMGAGVPSQILPVLKKYVDHEAIIYQVPITDSREKFLIHFNPKTDAPLDLNSSLNLPTFILVSGYTSLAQRMYQQRKADGSVLENFMAGGHNAPPKQNRGLNEEGEPIYSEEDELDFDTLNKTGMPYWLAGGHADNLTRALDIIGATGIQAGTIFALAKESGMDPDLRRQLLRLAFTGELKVRNNPVASPTGFPLEIAQLAGTLSDSEVFAQRMRACTLGYLVELYIASNGRVATRCPAEPIQAYLGHGGKLEDTFNRMCICNGLLASAGFGIQTKNGKEPPVVTLGKIFDFVPKLISSPDEEYTAEDALRFIFKRD